MLKFAVIGCGNLAQRSSIPALLKSGVSTIVVCVDNNAARGEEIKEKFGLPFEHSFESALNNYLFDAVYIATPNSVHKDYIIQAANNKKHILCEKSLASTIHDVIEIVDVCKANDVALFEGFMYQFHTQHAWIRDYVDSGAIGSPFLFQAWFGFPPLNKNDFRYKNELGGGAVLDAGAYTVHSARHFFKEEPQQVFSILENDGEEVEVRGSVMLGFLNGKTAHLVFGFDNCYQNTYSIWCTKGVLKLTRAFALPEDFSSTVFIERQGEKFEVKMDSCNHFVNELQYYCLNLNNLDYKKKWYEEAISQAIILDKIKYAEN
jgi:NDP-hexose-3-ketoreductase